MAGGAYGAAAGEESLRMIVAHVSVDGNCDVDEGLTVVIISFTFKQASHPSKRNTSTPY